MDAYIHQLTDYLHFHPHIGYLVTFVIAFAESVAIIGTIVPGSVIMTAIGVLIGSGVLPISLTLIFAVLGAFAGDFFSYWLGAHYQDRLRRIWPFHHKPQWLAVGEDFFKKHGGKSIVFGRFFGPARSLIPLVAGMMRMAPFRFAIASLPSATMWAILYIFPGILVGALSLELPKTAAAKLIFLILCTVAFGWLLLVLIHLFLKYLGQYIDRLAQKNWNCLAASPRTSKITHLLSSPDCSGHMQLIRIASMLLCSAVFLWLLISTYYHGVLTSFNEPLFVFFRSLRNPFLDRVMILIAFMGKKEVLLPTAVCIAIWLMWRRAIRAGSIYLGVIVLGAGVVEVIKTIFYSSRSEGLLDASVTSSFPSGHVVLAVVTFGFLAFLITENMTRAFSRKWVYMVAISLVMLIALSQLYLGIHWLTDILASLALGLILVLLGIIVYLRRSAKKLMSPGLLIVVSLCIFVPIWLGYSWLNFQESEKKYALYWSQVVIEEKAWWESDIRNEQIPLFVVSRLGKVKEVLNVQWVGNLDDITENLLKRGWVSHPVSPKFKETLRRLSTQNNATRLPLLPTLYHNKVPVRLFTRLDEKGNQITFMLWGSSVTLEGSSRQFWLGSIFYDIPESVLQGLPVKEAEMLYSKASQYLISSLDKHFEFRKIFVSESNQPSVLRMIHWGGELLLIKERS